MSVEVFEAKQRSGLSPPNIRAGSGSIPISLTSRCLKFCNTCAPMGRGPTSSRAAAKILCACTRSKSMASLLSRWSGTAGGTKYGYDKDGKPFLTKEPKLLLNDNDAGKPEGIHLMIGRPGRSTARRTRAACFRLREHGGRCTRPRRKARYARSGADPRARRPHRAARNTLDQAFQISATAGIRLDFPGATEGRDHIQS